MFTNVSDAMRSVKVIGAQRAQPSVCDVDLQSSGRLVGSSWLGRLAKPAVDEVAPHPKCNGARVNTAR